MVLQTRCAFIVHTSVASLRNIFFFLCFSKTSDEKCVLSLRCSPCYQRLLNPDYKAANEIEGEQIPKVRGFKHGEVSTYKATSYTLGQCEACLELEEEGLDRPVLPFTKSAGVEHKVWARSSVVRVLVA